MVPDGGKNSDYFQDHSNSVKHAVLQTQVELKYKYWKEELERDNLREILLFLPRPSHSRQNGKS